jgi:iron complex outermembrane recepter protein
MNKIRIAKWCASASAVALVGALPSMGFAQAAAATQPAAGGSQLGEVVVTAQRRVQRIQDVPASVVALSQAAITNANITSVKDIQRITPGLVFAERGSFSAPSIRGISSLSASPGNENNVAVYLDGVYIAWNADTMFQLPDVSRVEVLKGPQGTLFGRNTTGGAIRVFTLEPSDTPTLKVKVSDGVFANSHNDFSGSAFVSGPILGDTLKGSASIIGEDTSGWLTNTARGGYTPGRYNYMARGKLAFDPTSNFRTELTVFGGYNDDHTAFAYKPVGTNPAQFYPNLNPVQSPGQWQISENTDSSITIRQEGANFRAEYDNPLGTLTSLTSYSRADANYRLDGDASSLNLSEYSQLPQNDRTATQEFTLTSSGDKRLSYVAGLYLYYNDNNWHFNLDSAALTQPTPGPLTRALNLFANERSFAWSPFAELTFKVTDKLSVIGGLRYNQETKQLNGSLSALPPSTLIGKDTFSAATPRVAVHYEVSPDLGVYASYNRGFKSGLLDSATLSPVPIKPETVEAYEVGAKGNLSPTLRYDLSAFYYKQAELQVQAFVSIPAGTTARSALQNAAAGEIEGMDFDLEWAATPNLRVTAGGDYLPVAKYTSFPSAVLQEIGPTGVGVNITGVNLSGSREVLAATFNGNVGATYDIDLSKGLLTASTNLNFNSGYYYDVARVFHFKPTADLSANVAFKPTGKPWTFSVWGKNLTNNYRIGGALFVRTASFMPAPSREVGMTAEFDY